MKSPLLSHAARRCGLGALLALAACSTAPLGDEAATATTEESASSRSPAKLSFGATASQASAGGTHSFVLETTPDLVLHATLPAKTYEGQTLLVRGTTPTGLLAWSFPHNQHGTSFDVALHVIGSIATQRHITGQYTIQVTAPDGTVVAKGTPTFTSHYGKVASAPQL